MVQLLTTNSEEATVSDLLDGANIFSIPYFQRPYKWEKERIRQFEEDIEKIADDAYVMEQVQTRPLYGSRVLPFLISEYDRSFGGDVPSDIPWIEHVLPQNPVAGWKSKFSEQQMDQFVDVWANLIPLSSAMNANLSNDIYTKKRPKYKADSMFISARRFADQYDDWTPLTLAKRGKAIAQWAVKRWPY